MACYRPLRGYRGRTVNPVTGKRPVVFSRNEGFSDRIQEVPCGQCIGCRLEKSRQWAMRCMHEASLFEDNCFITLTYCNSDLPPNASLRFDDFQKFFKRLRRWFAPLVYASCEVADTGFMRVRLKYTPWKVRYFHCGEYGEERGRPHYHAVIFGLDFADKVEFVPYGPRARRLREAGLKVYWSETLARLWPYGTHEIGTVTFESAAHVARYVTKKVTGEKAEGHYNGRKPEYATMSRRPGLGSKWLRRFTSDVYPSDQVVLRGKVLKPPKYYDKVFEDEAPLVFADIKRKRRFAFNAVADDNTPERLEVKEVVKLAQAKILKRGL